MSLQALMAQYSVGNESDKGTSGAPQFATEDSTLVQSQLSMGEANALSADVDNILLVHEQAENHMTALQGLSDDISSICQDGMTTREAALVQSQISRYNQQVPAPFQVNIPGNESFSAAQRITQTQVGNEAIKDKAKDLAKWMSDLLTKVIEQIQKWVAKFFGGAEKLKAWSEATAKKADGFEPSDDNKKVTISTKLLAKGTTLPSQNSVASDFKEFSDKSRLIDTEYALIKGAFDAAVKAAEKSNAAEAVSEINGAYKTEKEGLDVDSTVPDGSVIGGKYIKVEEGKRTVASTESKISKDEIELKILTPSDVVKIADAVGELCDIVIGSKKLYGDNKKIKDEAVKASKSLDDLLSDDDTTSEQKTQLRALSRELSGYATGVIASGVHAKWASHSIAVAQAAAGYCNKSLA